MKVVAGEGSNTTGDIFYVCDTGATVTEAGAWTYVAAGTVTSVTPNKGQYATRVTISGSNLFGGGTNVTNNLIFNQCRESGDHGAMNAWYVRHEHACCSSRRR